MVGIAVLSSRPLDMKTDWPMVEVVNCLEVCVLRVLPSLVCSLMTAPFKKYWAPFRNWPAFVFNMIFVFFGSCRFGI